MWQIIIACVPGAHSVADSILGALALGDIGKHFPDNDEKYKNYQINLWISKQPYDSVIEMLKILAEKIKKYFNS